MKEKQMLELFNAWYPPPGIPISREAAWAAYQKGQRDLIEAMEPAAWCWRNDTWESQIHKGSSPSTGAIENAALSERAPVEVKYFYSLPEDTTK